MNVRFTGKYLWDTSFDTFATRIGAHQEILFVWHNIYAVIRDKIRFGLDPKENQYRMRVRGRTRESGSCDAIIQLHDPGGDDRED